MEGYSLPDGAALSFHEELLNLLWIRRNASLGGGLSEDLIKISGASLGSCGLVVLALGGDLAVALLFEHASGGGGEEE